MLVSTRSLLDAARAGGYAVGAFNAYNLELALAIVDAAASLGTPVILQLNSGALRFGGYAPLVALCRALGESAPVPVALHLDHATSLPELVRALDAGFTSLMIDGSKLPFQENVDLTRAAVELAHPRAIPVEAELGRLAGAEDAAQPVSPEGSLTDPGEAEQFARATGVDFLAVCVGNVHGFYAGEPRLDLERLGEIARRLSAPLVLHGTSGLPDAMVRQAIARGVAKFNVNTELRVAFFDTLAEQLARPHPGYDLPWLMSPVVDAVRAVVAARLEVFGGAKNLKWGKV